MRQFLFLQIIFIVLFSIGYGQDAITEIQAQWNQKKYLDVITLIDKHYATTKRRVLRLDLMKVFSMCQLGIAPPSTSDCFDYIMGAYKISERTKVQLNLAKLNCNAALKVTDERDITATTELPTVVGKMGNTTRQHDYEQRGDTLRLIKHISAETLRRRLVPDSLNREEAIGRWKSRYDSAGLHDVTCRATGKFMIAYSSLKFNDTSINEIINKLKRYYFFYIHEYNMKEPEHYIHLFLASNYKELKDVSMKLYGFSPPSYTLGYSSLDDLSIVAIAYVPQKPLLGTACHELFHVLCKNTFESLPAWLEEGMASLYEVSVPSGNQIKGLNNWRIQYLRNQNTYSYHKLRDFQLERILEMDWNKFNERDSRYEANQSFNYAYSRYLMLYLQGKGTLRNFFREASNYGYMDIREGMVKDYAKMVKRASGSESDFDLNFEMWLNRLPLIEH